jgi:ATP-binding cassette subfamily F protein 3
VLVEALKAYDGTILIVSHDRHFLKQLTTQVAQVDKGGVRFYPGTYSEYLSHIGES